jgi:hypothetical protein
MFESLIGSIQSGFSNLLPHDFCVPCFLKGLAEGIGFGALAIGALALVATFAAPIAGAVALIVAVAGIAGLAYMAANWKNMDDRQKSEALGEFAGGALAGNIAGPAAADSVMADVAAESRGATFAGNARPPVYETTPMREKYIGEDQPNNDVWPGSQVKYLNDEELAGYKLELRDGRMYDANGSLFDTSAASRGPNSGKAIFVMDENGSFYASNHQEIGEFHHSSLGRGEPVAAAGELQVDDGVLKGISDKSGHYAPGRQYTQQALDSLKNKGVDMDNVERDFIRH